MEMIFYQPFLSPFSQTKALSPHKYSLAAAGESTNIYIIYIFRLVCRCIILWVFYLYLLFSCFFVNSRLLQLICNCTHYQKIDKYKRKYRGNISVGKFSRDFTDGNIPSVYTEGITVGKKIKTKQKKNDDVSQFTNKFTDGTNSVGNSVGKFVGKLWTLFIMLITKGITDRKFRRYFPESKSPTDWKGVGVIWRFSEKIQLI